MGLSDGETFEERQASREARRKERAIADALATLKEHDIDVDALQSELALARQALDADHQAAELAQLRADIRDRDWHDEWRSVATEAGMHSQAVDHALAQHKPAAESDKPDRKVLRAIVDELRKDHQYLWPSDPTPAPAAKSEPTNGSGPRFTFAHGVWSNTKN